MENQIISELTRYILIRYNTHCILSYNVCNLTEKIEKNGFFFTKLKKTVFTTVNGFHKP